MNRGQLRDELAFLLSGNASSPDTTFSDERLNKLIQRAYNQVVERAKLAGVRAFFQAVSADITWTASSATLAVPAEVIGNTQYAVYDITGGEPGVELVFGDDSNDEVGDLYWRDNETWQWMDPAGPGSTLTLQVSYEKVAEDLLGDEYIPELIPPQYHELIVWWAGCLSRIIADEKIPNAWKEQRDEFFLDYCKYVSRGRPMSMVPSIKNGGNT